MCVIIKQKSVIEPTSLLIYLKPDIILPHLKPIQRFMIKLRGLSAQFDYLFILFCNIGEKERNIFCVFIFSHLLYFQILGSFAFIVK